MRAHRVFWQPAPFTTPAPAWLGEAVQLGRWVEGLSDSDCRQFEDDPERFAMLAAERLPSLRAREELIRLPALDGPHLALAEVDARDMPGRKRLQAGAFAGAVRPLRHDLLDWCCGKGHLARTLAPWTPGRLDGFEWDPDLVADGNRLARATGASVTLHAQDVLAEDCPLPAAVHGVALHACGDLHRRLMTRAAAAALPRLSLSPCCYHLTASGTHQPMSARVRQRSGRCCPGREELRLAVQETVTAPARVRQQTLKVSSRRLGFDGLQRQLRGVDEYLPVPSHPPALNAGSFADFCRWAAQRKGLTLPESLMFDGWEDYGRRRWHQVRRHQLVRHLFRRPLELWLVLDYALFLEEQGYRVRLGTFCDRKLTPRNILLDATLDNRTASAG